MKKVSKGSITVEAACVLPIFAICMLTLAFLMKLVYVHEVMQSSISHVANDISQYSYLYDKSGVRDFVDRSDKAIDDSARKVETQKKVLMNGISTINKLETKSSGSLDLNSLKEDNGYLNELEQNKNDMKKLIVEVKKNPGKEAVAIMCAILSPSKDGMKEKINETIVKYLCLLDISDESGSYNEKLKKMNILNSEAGLDFSGSTLNNGKDTKIVVTYKVRLPLPAMVKREFTLRNQAYVKNWIGNQENN